MSARVVLDASAALHLVLRTPHARRLADLLADASLVIAPGLFSAEVANGLWKYVRAGVLPAEAALECLDEATGLIDTLVPDADLCAEGLVEATRTGHPAYDLLYAVLARRNGCAILTMDDCLAGLLERLGIPAIGRA